MFALSLVHVSTTPKCPKIPEIPSPLPRKCCTFFFALFSRRRLNEECDMVVRVFLLFPPIFPAFMLTLTRVHAFTSRQCPKYPKFRLLSPENALCSRGCHTEHSPTISLPYIVLSAIFRSHTAPTPVGVGVRLVREILNACAVF